jgi:hypothetical protein
MLGERRAQSFEVALPERYRTAAGGAAGRVREPDELLPVPAFEELHDGGEPLLAGPLWKFELVD